MTSLDRAFMPPFQILTGLPCWAFAAGEGTGSQVSLHFGRKLPRLRAIDNPALQAELRTHEGEAVLFVECQWLLKENNRTVFDSRAESAQENRMLRSLELLPGASVSQIEVKWPLTGVMLSFDNQTTLEISADAPKRDDAHDNFSLGVGQLNFIVGPQLHVRIEPRSAVFYGDRSEGRSKNQRPRNLHRPRPKSVGAGIR